MSEPAIDILIIGFGAIGTIYGYILSQNPHVRVTGIARSNSAVMTERGINIESEKFGHVESWRPYRIVKDASEAVDRPYAYIIACFKCIPDLLPSASVLAPFLDAENEFTKMNDGPTVVLIQNGLGIEHPLQVAYPRIPIISAVAWLGANLHLHPGPRVTHGLLESLIIGLYQGEGTSSARFNSSLMELFADPAGYKEPGGEERRVEGVRRTNVFASLLSNGGGGVRVVADIQVSRYEKVIWNASWSAVCTLARKTVSEMVAPDVLPFTLPVVRRIGLECIYVAREWGYTEEMLPLKTVDSAISVSVKNYQVRREGQTPVTPMPRGDAFGGLGYGFPPSGPTETPESTSAFKPSMLLDVEAGRPSELEPIIGSLLDRARARGLETPRLDLIYATLKVNQDQAVRKFAQSEDYQEHIKNWFLRRPAVAGASIDGRKEWEKAVQRAGVEQQTENIAVRMANGKQKVVGKPITVADDDVEA